MTAVEMHRLTDIDSLMAWRREVISAVFGHEADAALLAANRDYYSRHIPDGSHVAFVAFIGGEEAGCGAFCITEELPSPDNPSGRCAYLMNVYVRTRFRLHGVGHRIVGRLVSEAKAMGCGKIYLETTAEARTMYQGIGFRELTGIMKFEK